MRRLPLLLATCAALAVAAPAAPAAAAVPAPAVPAPAPPATPEAVPAAFVAAVSTRGADVSPCSLMTRGLREAVAADELVRDPLASEPWDPADATALCDAKILRETASGFPVVDRSGWIGAEVARSRIVHAAGDVVQARVRVVQRYRPRDGGADETEANVVDLLVMREEGVWRLASARQLLEFAGPPASETIADFQRERAQQDELTRRMLRGHARTVQGLATLARPLARETIGCGTGAGAVRSGRSEPSARGRRGVFRIGLDDDALERVRDPRAAGVDMVDARLRSGRGRLCWTFLLRGPVAERVDVELLMAEEGNDDEDAIVSWTLRLDGGRGVGLLDGAYARPVVAVRASVHGRVVRVVVPARRVRGHVRTGRPFGWSVMARAPDPDRAPGSRDQWVDTLPALYSWDDLAGIKHRPRR